MLTEITYINIACKLKSLNDNKMAEWLILKTMKNHTIDHKKKLKI